MLVHTYGKLVSACVRVIQARDGDALFRAAATRYSISLACAGRPGNAAARSNAGGRPSRQED